VPIGVIGCIYEARPNVTVDIAALALKSGNAAVLRGGKEAKHTNRALGELIQRALADTGVPGDAVQVVSDPDRAHVEELLKANDLIDLVVPRGSEALIAHVRANATMPVVAHGEAVVHVYVDAGADLEMALEIVDNAKTRRYSICNAVDTVLVHVDIAPRFLAALAKRWAGSVTMIAGERALALLAGGNGTALQVERATDATWRMEHLALRAGIKLVDSIDEAVEHIERYGSHHSDAIVTNDYAAATRFVDEVDSAVVYVNASTQYTDGAQFGLGAEVGISTQKMHARGPMGLVELTSYKWIAMGTGQVRPA
jgi:glutamate-5-semialdehyde dehydrogenase